MTTYRTWQEGMKDALTRFVLEQGTLVRQVKRAYRDYSQWQENAWEGNVPDTHALARHTLDCGLDLERTTWRDSDWEEFAGTFAEPPWDHRTGTDVTVFCRCGRVQGRDWRYTGSLADLITAITKD